MSTSNLHKAAHKASSCLRKGAIAAAVTSAANGLAAAAVSWIPGVDAITAASVGLATARAGGATFVTCLLGG